MTDKKWTWRTVKLELRRAIGVTLLGWVQSVWPTDTAEDLAIHRLIGEMAKVMMERTDND
jgi:hypothetical protein